MYIPSTFHFNVTGSISASGGDMYDILSGSELWRVHDFLSTGSHQFIVHTGSSDQIKLLVVGGGGAGGYAESRSVDSGPPYYIPAPGQVATLAAGGGGAGGVVYIESSGSDGGDSERPVINPIGTGSILIGPSTYNVYVGQGGQESGSNGQSSYFEYFYSTDQDPYVFNTNKIEAGPGGAGGSNIWTFNDVPTPQHPSGPGFDNDCRNASDGASGGGATVNAWGGATAEYGFSGSNIYPWDYQGGDGAQTTPPSITRLAQSGGGAGRAASDTGGDVGDFGGARTFTMLGFEEKFGYGGSGIAYVSTSGKVEYASLYSTSSMLSISGSGGTGDYWSLTNKELVKGRDGIVRIMYPLPIEDLNNCTQYVLDGGAFGGNFTFLPCGSSSLETVTLDFSQSIAICAYPILNYPSASGTLTYIETGSCSIYIEPIITGACDTGSGEVKEESYIYNWQSSGTNGPPYNAAPDVRIEYYNTDGVFTVYETPSSPWDLTYSGQFCAREFPAPIAYITTTYPASVSLTKTDLICGYYCTTTIQNSGSLEATGGVRTDHLITTSPNTADWYRVHTFTSNGTFAVTSGSASSSFDFLVVAGGGRGQKDTACTAFGSGQSGGGGAGGVLYVTSSNYYATYGNTNVTVGNGGTQVSDNAQNSFLYGGLTYTAIAGGKGGRNGREIGGTCYDAEDGFAGGSGGGGGGSDCASPGVGGARTLGQGNVGGNGASTTSGFYCYDNTSHGGGGGGAASAGIAGNASTNTSDGGAGRLIDINFTNTYYGGGGAGSHPSASGGIGGGGNPTQDGAPNTGGGGGAGTLASPNAGDGGSGIVILRYLYKADVQNSIINSLPVSESLWSLIDLAYTESYNGTGSTLYDIADYPNDSYINNRDAYEYNTLVLDGSGSMILETSSLDTSFYWDTGSSLYPTFQDFTLVITWQGNNLEYNSSSADFPIFSDTTSGWGIYGGDFTTWDSGIVIRGGGQEYGVGNNTAIQSGGGGGIDFHVSQISYNGTTGVVNFNCDNYSGSYVHSGSALPTDFAPKWNQKYTQGKLGNTSAMQVMAIYSSSLSLSEMQANHDYLNQRYL